MNYPKIVVSPEIRVGNYLITLVAQERIVDSPQPYVA